MKRFIPIAPIAFAGLVAAVGACASEQQRPPPELVEARSAYARAASGPAASANPGGLYEGKRSLDAAERKQADDPGSDEARSLAYIADRKILLAEANGRLAMAQAQEEMAKAQLAQLQQQQLAQAKGQLGETRGELAAERNARMEADRRAKEAIDKLQAFASVKADGRRTIITLSGSVLFATNQSDLLPTARARLVDVAGALKQVQNHPIVVIGYTDNMGTDEHNKQLSQRRAESVRGFLVSQGVKDDMITAMGRGKADPVASNASPEGRANNRRVEIVIEVAKEAQTSKK
jgi:outer membrane protein OmpA-like peptidoglycan-associated protein